MRRTVLRFALLILVPAVAIAGAIYFWLQGARYVSTENAYVHTDIAKVTAEVSGTAIEVRARAHMKVEEGDVLVRIDPRPYEIALKRAEAELDSARQEVETKRAELAEARTELEEAKDEAAYFEKRYQRQIELSKRGVVSASRHDEFENDARAARDRVRKVMKKIQRVMAALGGDPDGPVDAHPLVRMKQAAVEDARLDLENTHVRAPSDGTVAKVPLVAGEQVTTSDPLFAIVTDRSPWVDANYKETELTHVEVGQTATIAVDTYPDVTWEAEVKSISPATGAEFAVLPPQNASGNWVKVVQRLPVRLKLKDKPGAPALRSGMTAKVTIDTKQERSLAELLGSFTAIAGSRAGW